MWRRCHSLHSFTNADDVDGHAEKNRRYIHYFVSPSTLTAVAFHVSYSSVRGPASTINIYFTNRTVIQPLLHLVVADKTGTKHLWLRVIQKMTERLGNSDGHRTAAASTTHVITSKHTNTFELRSEGVCHYHHQPVHHPTRGGSSSPMALRSLTYEIWFRSRN